jgi:hypothetical protein
MRLSRRRIRPHHLRSERHDGARRRPQGAATVVCQDRRLSFISPGDVMPTGETMPNTCLDFDCGAQGQCVAVNMTPTCVCEKRARSSRSNSATIARICMPTGLAIIDARP